MLEQNGYNVIGVDINTEYVEKLNSKTFVCNEPFYNELLQESSNFKASSSLLEGINHSNIIFIIVQTPNSGGEKFYDHSILSNLLVKINKICLYNYNWNNDLIRQNKFPNLVGFSIQNEEYTI